MELTTRDDGLLVLNDAYNANPASVRAAIDALARLGADREALDEMRRRARELAVTRFNAEAQRPNLMRAWGL